MFLKEQLKGIIIKGPRKRKDLQLALHALACRLAAQLRRDPLRDKIREVGRGLSLADISKFCFCKNNKRIIITTDGPLRAALLKTTFRWCEGSVPDRGLLACSLV